MTWRSLFLFLAMAAAWGCCAETKIVHADEHTLYLRTKHLLDSYRGQSEYLSEATRLTRLLESKYPESPLTLVSKGRLQLIDAGGETGREREEHFGKAINIFERAGTLAPDFADPVIYGAYARMAEGTAQGLHEARAMSAKADRLAPGSPWVELLLGIVAAKEGDGAEMLAQLRRVQARTSQPGLVSMAHDYMARYYLAQKNYRSAEKSFLRIIELNPDSPWDHANFSLFLLRINDLDRAVEYGERALEIREFDLGQRILARAYYEKGAEMHWIRRRYEESKIFFLKALQRDPTFVNARYGLAMAYYQTGYGNKNAYDLEKAEEELAMVLELQPDHGRARAQAANLRQLRAWLAGHQAASVAGPIVSE